MASSFAFASEAKNERLSEIKSFKVCGRSFKLEIARSEAERNKGLMFRKSVAADEGMLFVFEAPEAQTFWMKNVPIALDILFFDAKGKVINTATMAAESPLVQDLFLKRYSSDRPSQFVVELKDGILKTFKPHELKTCTLSPLPKI
jgi:uncharacterized membrane protein (UPF0127 family)